MDSSSSSIKLLLLLCSINLCLGIGCYTSIFNFGDSLSDTGNLCSGLFTNETPHFCFSPYGETFFHRPTGRCSDGRLILDFIAESLGLPLVQPYLGREMINSEDFWKGLNFAVAGATALNYSFLKQKGIIVSYGNYTLNVQLEWFKKTFSSICPTSSSRCRESLGSSLILMGEIGGNDYNYPFFDRRSFDEIKSFVPLVIKTISSAITDLIEMGAKTLMVPGNLPIGCSSRYLKIYKTSDKDHYDHKNGCLKWLNEFSEYHNERLQVELKRIQARHPSVNIIYGDYYNAAMQLYNAPQEFGFKSALQICCGGSKEECGGSSSIVCKEPSKYVSWDGIHLTEAAYRVIANSLVKGNFTTPWIRRTKCDVSPNASTNQFDW